MPSCLLLLTRAQFSTCGFRLAFIPAILKIVIASSSNSSSAEWTSWVLAARALSATISRLLSYSSCSGSVRETHECMYVCLASISPWRQNNEFSSSKRKGRHWKKINSESPPYVCGGNFHFNLLRVYSILFSVQDLQQEGKSSKGHQSGGGGMICRQEVFTMSRT